MPKICGNLRNLWQKDSFFFCRSLHRFAQIVKTDKKMKQLLFFVFVNCQLLFLNCFAQDTEEIPQPPSQIKQFKHSIKAGAGLPVILSNSPFKKTMDGVYSVNGSADFSLYKPIIAGVYYGYAMFDNAELKGNKGRRPDVTKGYFSSAGASIGYEKFISENKVISISANSGYSWINYKRAVSFTDTVTNLLKTEALTMGITASYSIIIEETGGIGFFVSYRYLDNIFEPKKILFVAEESEKKTQILSIGVLFLFGF